MGMYVDRHDNLQIDIIDIPVVSTLDLFLVLI